MISCILVVDDNRYNVRLLTDILEDEHYTVVSTDNGGSVLEMVRKLKPEVILLDIMMPGLDGFEVCKLLKSDFDIKHIPVIMVTAKTDGQDLKKALEIGAFDYIKKPIDEVEVIARVQSAIRFKQYQDKLIEMAMKDGLTGLYNHALLIDLFVKELARIPRNGGNISFAMLDIDYFKKVNDTYGHMCGDIVLKEVSNILISSVRSGDIVGRYGGEEFGLVILEATEENALQICDKIRKKIEDFNFNIGIESIKITVSIGVFFKQPTAVITASEIIQKADEALYEAKRNGRNRIENALN
ncbi:MAG TPA: diguanylate cyclase [Desulfosporosinus sp.]